MIIKMRQYTIPSLLSFLLHGHRILSFLFLLFCAYRPLLAMRLETPLKLRKLEQKAKKIEQVKIDKQKGEALIEAAQYGLTNALRILFDQQELRMPELCGQALIKAAENGHEDSVVLILNSMPIESTNNHEYITAYYNARVLAAQHGHASVVNHLLYNPDHKSKRGHTLLSQAVIAGHPSVVRTIVTQARDFTSGYAYGQTHEQEKYSPEQSVVNLTKDATIKKIVCDAIRTQRSEQMLQAALAATQAREARETRRAHHQDCVLEYSESLKEHAYALAKIASQRRSDLENARTDADAQRPFALPFSPVLQIAHHSTLPESSPSSSQDLSDAVYISLQQTSDEDDQWVVDDFDKH